MNSKELLINKCTLKLSKINLRWNIFSTDTAMTDKLKFIFQMSLHNELLSSFFFTVPSTVCPPLNNQSYLLKGSEITPPTMLQWPLPLLSITPTLRSVLHHPVGSPSD